MTKNEARMWQKALMEAWNVDDHDFVEWIWSVEEAIESMASRQSLSVSETFA